MEQSKDFCLNTRELVDLVVPPSIDPFSDYEPARTGEAVLPRAIRKWDLSGRWDFSTVKIYVPQEKINTSNQIAAEKMLHHYFQTQLEEITMNKSLFYRNAFRVFRNALLFLTVCMAIVAILSNEHFLPSLPPLIRKVLTEGFTVIGWVVLWRPVEFMLNEFGELRKSDQIYHKLLRAKIEFLAGGGQ